MHLDLYHIAGRGKIFVQCFRGILFRTIWSARESESPDLAGRCAAGAGFSGHELRDKYRWSSDIMVQRYVHEMDSRLEHATSKRAVLGY